MEPLLSEWTFLPGFGRWRNLDPQGFFTAIAAAISGLVLILLSHFAGAACTTVTLGLKAAPNAQPVSISYGYQIELNHGLFVLVGVPILLLGAFHFLDTAQDALRRLAISGRLTPPRTREDHDALGWISDQNRRLFRPWLILVLVILIVCLVVGPELFSTDKKSFGWVQSMQASALQGCTIDKLDNFEGLKQLPGVKALVPSGTKWESIAVVSVRTHPACPAAFWPFLVTAMLWQALVVSFCVWLFFKIGFFFRLVLRALPTPPLLGRANVAASAPRIRLDFYDTGSRFGLGTLDEVYDTVLFLSFVGGLDFLFSVVSNASKGTPWVRESGELQWTFVGQPLLLLLPAAGFLLVVGIPAAVIRERIRKAKQAEIELIETQERALDDEIATIDNELSTVQRLEEQIELQRRKLEIEGDRQLQRNRKLKQVVENQVAYPKKDPAYKWLVGAAVLVLFALPFGITGIPGEWVQNALRVIQQALRIGC